MARTEGSLKLSSNFEVRLNAPVDARLVVPTKTDLYSMEYFYRGMRVYVHDEGVYYELVNDLPAFEASWKQIGDGGEYDFVEITEADIDAMFEGSTPSGGGSGSEGSSGGGSGIATNYDDTDIKNRLTKIETLLTDATNLRIGLKDSTNVTHSYDIVGKEVTE